MSAKIPNQIMFAMVKQLCLKCPDLEFRFVVPEPIKVVSFSEALDEFKPPKVVTVNSRDVFDWVDEIEKEIKDMPTRAEVKKTNEKALSIVMQLCEAHLEIKALKETINGLWRKRG